MLGAVFVIAGQGGSLRRAWGWGLAAVLVRAQTAGSVVNTLLGGFWEGATRSLLAGAILYFLFRPQVRNAFRKSASREHGVV